MPPFVVGAAEEALPLLTSHWCTLRDLGCDLGCDPGRWGPQALDRFRQQPNGVLVATDVAARGLDVDNIRCVVGAPLPAGHRSPPPACPPAPFFPTCACAQVQGDPLPLKVLASLDPKPSVPLLDPPIRNTLRGQCPPPCCRGGSHLRNAARALLTARMPRYLSRGAPSDSIFCTGCESVPFCAAAKCSA